MTFTVMDNTNYFLVTAQSKMWPTIKDRNKKLVQQAKQVRIPTGFKEQASQKFTSLAKELNIELPKTNPADSQSGA